MNASAVRLSGDCPKCGKSITVKRRRSDDGRFVSCTGYPACNWAGDYDEELDNLAQRFVELEADLRSLRQQLERRPSANTNKALRDIIAFAHPDRWPQAQDLAHGVVSRLNALRERI